MPEEDQRRENFETGSVTTLYVKARDGCADSAEAIVARLLPDAFDYARRRFGVNHSLSKSCSDFAIEGATSFHRRLVSGQLEIVDANRDSLTAYLTTLVLRKGLQHHRQETADRRGAGRVVQQSCLNPDDAQDLEQTAGYIEPSTLDADVAELFDVLEDDTLCEIALMAFAGFTQREIAQHLGFHQSSIERKLRMIRAIWSKHFQ